MSDDEMEVEAGEEDATCTLANADVVTKYKAAADIANRALAFILAELKPGVKVFDVCVKGDKFMEEELAKVFNKKTKEGEKMEKAVAFPTCISLNHCVSHWSPDSSDTTEVKDGDFAKIDLGVHIDGYVGTVAHTAVVGAAAPLSGPAGDLFAAAHTAGELLLRVIRPGNKTSDLGTKLEEVAEAYGVKVVEGVLSHQMKRFVIDGNKVVLNRTSPEFRADEAEFEVNEVYAVDVVLSTGEGKPRQLDEKHTQVYKRALDRNYNLKMKASRAVFSEINKRFPTMPFAARALVQEGEGDAKCRLGLVECLGHELLHPYPVLWEKPGDLVAHFKFTVLLMPNGSDKITGLPAQPHASDKSVESEEIKALLATSVKNKKAKKKAAKEVKA